MNTATSIQLSENQIHIWRFPIKASHNVVAAFEAVLAPEERERAVRFRFDHLYASFVLAHGALRHLLGNYLKCNPSELSFELGVNGKPALAPPSSIRFSMTHSGDLGVIALTLRREIGVDIEQIRPLPGVEHIAGRFFCPEEVSEVMSAPGTERNRAFFRCWTRKEAYIKATGDGLSAALSSFRVIVHPDLPVRIIHIQHNATEAEAWTLHDLPLAAGYAAALAYRDQRRSLQLFSVAAPEELIS